VALATRLLCKRVGLRSEEQAFLAGLMHDAGEMILVHGDARGFEQLAREAEQTHKELVAMEREVYGFDHTQIGVSLLEAWNIDEAIKQSVLHHHTYDAPEEPGSITPGLQCAEYLCAKADLGFFSEPPEPPAAFMAAAGCGTREQVAVAVAEVRKAYETESALFRPM
jgi:HD-like signal output (HDOD) protein